MFPDLYVDADTFYGSTVELVSTPAAGGGSGGRSFMHAAYRGDLAKRRAQKQQREEEEIMTVITAFLATRKAA